MREAFTYMFKDPGYNNKATVYFVICFISLALMASPEIANLNSTAVIQGPKVAPVTNPTFMFLPILGSIFNWILCGYYFTCVQALTQQNQNYVLPFLKIGGSFLKGIKFTIAIILISIVLTTLGVLLSVTGPIGIAIFAILAFLLFVIWGNAFMWLFANEGKFSTYFAWKKVTRLVSENSKTYFKNWFLLILLTLAGAIASILFMLLFNFLVNNIYLAWILTSIEGAIIASYTAFVGMYLIAKSIKPETVV